MSMQDLNHPYDFDLSKHGWIEASAGTGKTFTIERLVVRAIVEEKIPISSILTVTFTEKATGELKDRIRGLLQNIVDGSLAEGDRQWFEEQQRKHGKQEASKTFAFVKDSLDRFDEAAIFTIHGFCQSLLTEYSFELGRLLKYELVNDNDLLETLIPDALRRLPVSESDLLERLVRSEFWKVTHSGEPRLENTVRNLLRMLKGNVELRLSSASEDSPMQIVLRMVRSIQDNLTRLKAERGWISYDDMILHVRDALCPTTDRFKDQATDRAADQKKDPDTSRKLASAIGERFRFAIIDEFQDTDALQWDIFSACFLDSGRHVSRTSDRRSDVRSPRLILVGDPKQSIYGFRGADLNAYFRAKKRFVALAEKGEAHLYRINRNFRSSPEYIQALNAIFQSEGYPWNVASDDNDLAYVLKDCPTGNRWEGTELPPGRRPMNLWRPENADGAAAIRLAHARHICNEIRFLTAGGHELCKDGRRIPVSYGDICILARSKKEATGILGHLRTAGIPASFYKQAGVFESVEALEILYVLEALAEPARSSAVQKALLTRFFGISIELIQAMDELPVDHPFRERMQRWHELAGENRWPQLFREMMTVDELFALVHADAGGWERSLTNYEQIFHALEERALRNGLDLIGIVRQLKELIREGSLEEEETLHKQETEEQRVRVMTIHASKGLEFPIVFIYGGLTEGTNIDFFRFYEEEHPVIVPVPWFDPDKKELDRSESGLRFKELHKSFARAENARLYYVALTRAAVMCYIPTYRPNRNAGPVGSFLQDALDEAMKLSPNVFAEVRDQHQTIASISRSPIDGQSTAHLPEPVLSAHLQERKADLLSYSSIVRQRAERIDREELDHDASASEVILETSDVDVQQTSLDMIFRGAEAGNFFHEILERLDFQDDAFREEQPSDSLFSEDVYPSLSTRNRSLIRRKLDQYGYRTDSDHEGPVVLLLHRLMRTQILPGFRLCDLKPADRIHEMEFVFRYSENVAGIRGERFFTGFIDLVFRHEGRIYLLDWKTNRLPAYDRPHLDEAMRSHQYDLQYSLYARALSGWLESRGHDPVAELGGVIYLFLRGVRPGASDGIFFETASLEEVSRKLAREIGA